MVPDASIAFAALTLIASSAGRTTTSATTGSSSNQPGAGALDNDLALHGTQCAEDVEHEPSARRRRVDALGDRLERDATPVQIVSDVDQMPQAACKSIETPNHQHVVLADLFEYLGKLRPIGPCTRSRLDKHLVAPGSTEGIELQGMVLLIGTDPRIPQQHDVLPKLNDDPNKSEASIKIGFRESGTPLFFGSFAR